MMLCLIHAKEFAPVFFSAKPTLEARAEALRLLFLCTTDRQCQGRVFAAKKLNSEDVLRALPNDVPLPVSLPSSDLFMSCFSAGCNGN